MTFEEEKNILKHKVLNNIDLDEEELFNFAICFFFPRLHDETVGEDDFHEDRLTITEVDGRPFAIKWKSAKNQCFTDEFNEQPFECEFEITEREKVITIKTAKVKPI